MKWTEKDPYQWQRWFAWYPVNQGRDWVWLETVERRINPQSFYGLTEYRTRKAN